ncbi:MAG: hypothetical protein QM764_05625 [Chitinophagaceae bacterium]
MKSTNRDLLVLLKDDSLSESAIEHQVECLHFILHRAESSDQFCMAHELVDRNRITQKHSKLLKAISEPELKPFRFLIGKN